MELALDNNAWIERDPRGRYMFVRKRNKIPSTQSLFSDGLGTSNNPFGRSRSLSRSHSISRAGAGHRAERQAPVRIPTSSTIPTPLPSSVTLPAPIMGTNPEKRKAVIHDSGQYSHPPLLNGRNQQSPYPPHPTYAPSYLPSYPTYYLAPNAAPAPAPAPAPPLTREPYSPIPSGARLVSPRQPTADELKYKCSICGKFRSPRFHYKHPIPPGELPALTVCRKCRQTGTDSEDSSDERDHFRGVRRRSASVISVSEPIRCRHVTERASQCRRQSRSRVRLARPSRSYSRHRGRRRQPTVSSSSSLDLGDLDSLVDERVRRARSRSASVVVERVRYVDESPPRHVSFPEETIYIQENRDPPRHWTSRYEKVYCSDSDCDSEDDRVSRRRTVSKISPAARTVRQQYSEPIVREKVQSTTRDYFDGPASHSGDSAVGRRARGPPSSLTSEIHVLRVPEDETQRIRERLANDNEYELIADRRIRQTHCDEEDGYEDGSRRRSERRGRRRSRSRLTTLDSPDRDGFDPTRILRRVPTPGPRLTHRRTSARESMASRQDPDSEVRHVRQRETHHHRGPPGLAEERSRSRSESQSGPVWKAPFGGWPSREALSQ